MKLRFGGYGPPDSTHSRALDLIAAEFTAGFGGDVNIDIAYNILDTGRQAFDLVGDVEAGDLTLCYFSTSYLVQRVPELAVIDLPFAFGSLRHAHACLDGALGRALTALTEQRTQLAVLGYWDNGFRHVSNRLRPVRDPADLAGLRIRLQPSPLHEQLFAALGAVPVPTDLKEGVEMIADGRVDAQENPLANFVAYGVADHHPYLTMSGHLYGARGVYADRALLASWPPETAALLRRAARTAIDWQRAEAARKEDELRRELTQRGTAILDLTAQERARFEALATPVRDAAAQRLGAELFGLVQAEA